MSSQKQKTPAEELMDSLLNEVENSDNLSKSGFALNLEGLAPEEASEEGAGATDDNTANRTLVATSVADEEDSEIQGIIEFDPTAVGSMSFEGLLRNKKSNDKTDVRTALAKTEVRPELAKTEVRPANQATVVRPQSETAIIGQEFSSEEANAYEATRIGAPPTGEENQHTEFGELELEPMEANVVDLQALQLAEQKSDDNEDFLKTEIRPATPPVPQPEKIPVADQQVTQAEIEAALSLFSASSAAPAQQPPAPPTFQVAAEADENVKTQVIPTADQAIPVDADSRVGTVAVDGLANALRAEEPKVSRPVSSSPRSRAGDSEGTVAVTGFQIKPEDNLEGKVKVSIGKPGRSSSGYSSWGGGVDSNLSQAENLRMAQEKILALENENEKLRRQNEELIAASEILKERSDLMTSQLTEYKNDREGLEQSFKNEMTLLKNHVARKDAELRRAQIKVEELESRLKFDLKKIRVRERELENRLELVRAEKNAISKNKDEQILDLRRKMDLIQMEVDSYRQKCIELNKQIETSQDSFKRTTRALRLAMANLELQEENKGQLKKAE